MSAGASEIAVEISHALGESLSEIRAQYFRDNDVGNVVQDLAEERAHLQEELQAREDWVRPTYENVDRRSCPITRMI
jgi:hypothetical protein